MVNNIFWGVLLTRQGFWDDAKEKLSEGLAICENLKMTQNIPQALAFLGQLYEIQGKWNKNNRNQSR